MLGFAAFLLVNILVALIFIAYALKVITNNQVNISANRRQESNDLLLALSSMHKVLLDGVYKSGKV